MDNELKPCPFCGGNDLAVESATPDWSVACLNPACPVKPDCWIGFSRKQAVEGWNTRALEAENAALKARGPVLSEAEVGVLEYIKDVLKSVNNMAGVEVIGNLLERAKR